MHGIEEQRLAALERANAMRHDRAELKRDIAGHVLSLPEVLRSPPEPALGCSLSVLLLSQRGWGRQRTARFLRRNGLVEGKTLRDLSSRQRALLADQLD